MAVSYGCGCSGSGGGGTAACCAPSTSTQPFCLADGSTILAVYQVPCAACDAVAVPPELTGYLNPSTGVFTPGPLPADAGPCGQSARQISERCGCDDVNGDGSVINRYIELWSVDADGVQGPALIGTWLDGDFTQPYVPANPVDCPAEPGCASPTTPVTSVGLCLADGTPIAVTVVRDCDGTVTSEGWLNLTTGAWTAGGVPVGTVACGDSRSIQVSGTFCAVDDTTGDVVGLVLIEYRYATDGTIASVRLVDATTGATYTPPTGVTVTTCPTGEAQPEQDAVILCNTAADGTVTQFVRDYRRDENGAIVAHSDYTLDGAAYSPAGTVGVCQADDCETEQLCDVQKDVTAVLPSVGVPTEAWQDLPNGVRWMRRGADGAAPGGWYVADAGTPERFDFDRPVSITYAVRFSGPTAAPLRIPAGWYLDSINTGQHAWNAGTRVISPTASATQAGLSTFRIETQTARSMTAPVVVGTQLSGQTSQYGQITVTADLVTLLLRTLCRDSAGTATVTDTLLDGVTPYTVLGTAGRCTETPPSSCRDCETLVLCDGGADVPATITGTASGTGTLSNGVTYAGLGSSGPQNSGLYDGGAGEGTWWPGVYGFPNVQIGPASWQFDRPSYVEFSVYMRYYPFTTGDASNPNPRNETQLPANVEPVYLPDGYHYDPLNHVVSVDESRGPVGNEPCSNLTAPTIAESARFRTTEPVSSVRTRYWGVRVANCGVFGSQRVGAFTVTPAGQFLRHVCRDCEGSVSSVTDTLMDGTTPYVVVGAVGACADPKQCDQSVLSECVYRLPDTANGFDTEQATFPGCWLGTATNPTYTYGDRVTSWEGTYQSSTGTVSSIGFTSPDLGGAVSFAAFTPALPASPAQSSPAYRGTAVINGVTVTLTAIAGNGLSASGTLLTLDPGDGVRIEFSEPVRFTVTTSAFADPPTPHNERLCGVVAATVPWRAVKLADCEGVITVVDQDTRQPLPAGAAVDCDCCTPGPVCIGQNPEQSIHFITNEEHLEDNSVDPTWKWSLTPDDPAATWYDMYEGAHGWVSAWTVRDTNTERPAWWLSAHPNGNSAQSNPPLPGEGPSLVNTHWYARAFFDLPAGADPGSIQVQVTVLNADQFARAVRLNNGPWQPLPASACYSVGNGCVAYTFGPGSIPGAQAGRNFLYLDVEETVGGASGLMAHLIVTYQIGRPEQRSWTRMVCCDDTVYYLDENGDRQDTLPDGWSVVPCGITSHPTVLCDDAGTFLRHVTYTSDGQVLISDTDVLGGPYSPTGPVRSCT